MSTTTAYLAGLLDGEGCVTVSGGDSNRSHQLRVTLEMTDPEPIYLLQENYGGTIHERERPHGRRLLFSWYISGGVALDFLADILPHSLAKENQIIEALKFPYFPGVGRTYGKHRPMPPEIVAELERIKRSLAGMKERRTDV